ncbi:hypothetical protein [Cellulomonas sp.]|nr:hypothetical protein [Cellulomonas sp.]
MRQHAEHRGLLSMQFVLDLQGRSEQDDDTRALSVLSQSFCPSTLSLLFC